MSTHKLARKRGHASPPTTTQPKQRQRRRRSTSTTARTCGASIDLQFSRLLRSQPDYAIEGVTPDGKPSLSLYKWNGNHWKYVHPEIAKSQALGWLEQHHPDKYSASQADACLAAAVGQMDTATAVTSMEEKRGKRVIVPLQGQYLELVDGKWHILPPDISLGMTYAVPATINPARIKDGVYQPSPVPTKSKFGQYLARFIPSSEDQEKLAEIAAASLIPGGVEKAFLLLGGGANGKSTILHILEAFHPTTHTVLRLECLGGQFGLAAVAGKSLAIAWELPPFIGTNSEQVLKSLVSRDTVQIEKKHKDPVSITPRATVYIAANAPPRFTDHTYGLERKIEAFAFNQRIDDSEKVVGYDKEITGNPKELAVALDWMLEGINRLVARGGFTGQTNSQRELAETIKIESDSVYAFLKHEGVVLPPEDLTAKQWYTSKKAVYTAYRENTLDSGQKPVAAPQFWRTMKQRMDAKGQQLIEVRSRAGSDRERVVNLATGDNLRLAESWLQEVAAAKTTPARSVAVSDDSDPIPF